MRDFFALLSVIEYIEQNLTEPLELGELARAAFMSLSNLHRVFRLVFRCSPREYITKRRMCKAAFDLINSDARITDIALDYQYGNAESFTRAFRKQFLVTPSEFRKDKRTFYDLYPRLFLSNKQEGDFSKMEIRKYNVNELGEQILAAKGTYIFFLDIDNFMIINDTYGHDIGDAVLAETTARIERSILSGMTLIRIGGDEFTVLTGSDDLKTAEKVAADIISSNNIEFNYNGKTIKYSVSIGIAAIPEEFSDIKEALAKAESAMLEAKRSGRNTYRVM